MFCTDWYSFLRFNWLDRFEAVMIHGMNFFIAIGNCVSAIFGFFLCFSGMVNNAKFSTNSFKQCYNLKCFLYLYKLTKRSRYLEGRLNQDDVLLCDTLVFLALWYDNHQLSESTTLKATPKLCRHNEKQSWM